MHHTLPLKNGSMWQGMDCTCINLGKVIAQSIDLQAMSIHFNGGMVSLDKAMVFNDSIWERPLVKAEIVYAPMLFIEAWSCETRNGLKMLSYGGGHWSRHCFATHKQCHCLEMYPYAFSNGFQFRIGFIRPSICFQLIHLGEVIVQGTDCVCTIYCHWRMALCAKE